MFVNDLGYITELRVDFGKVGLVELIYLITILVFRINTGLSVSLDLRCHVRIVEP